MKTVRDACQLQPHALSTGLRGRRHLTINKLSEPGGQRRVELFVAPRGKTFEGLKQASEKSATFEGIVLTLGQGNRMIAVNVGEIAIGWDANNLKRKNKFCWKFMLFWLPEDDLA